MTEDQFYIILNKYLNNSISEQELIDLQKEIEVNSERKIVFQYLANSKVDKYSSNELDIIFNKLINNTEIQEEETSKRINILRIKKLYTYIAAAILLIIGSVSYQVFFNSINHSNVFEATTKYAERKEFLLPDGTKVWLNAGSTIKYNLDDSQNKRLVTLDGEGFFDVAHNKEKPMIITAKELEIRVIGTSFNVRAYKDENLSEASLITGKIALQIKSNDKVIQKSELNPGEKIKVFANLDKQVTKSVEKTPIESQPDIVEVSKSQITALEISKSPKEIAWTKNYLVMDRESLKEALPKLERWFDSKLIINNPMLDTMKITGPFQEKTIEELIHVLKLSGLPINYKKDINNQIILY